MFIKFIRNLFEKKSNLLGQKLVPLPKLKGTSTSTSTKTRTSSKAVYDLIELVSTENILREVSKEKTKETYKENLEDSIDLFKKYLLENSIDEKLPSNDKIKNDLGLTDKKLKNLKKELFNSGFLDKINPTKYRIVR